MSTAAGRRAQRLAAAALLSLAGCLGPPPQPPTPDEIVAGLSRLILAPEATCAQLRDAFDLHFLPLVDYPSQAGMPFEQATVPVADGIGLRVWYIPAEEQRGVIVLSAGAAGSMACYLHTPWLLTQAGWSVVMYEYEGFGGSTGAPLVSTIIRDLEAVVDWSRARTGTDQVTVMGVSLGTIPSVAVAVARPDAVNAVVLDSPVALGLEIERFRMLLRQRTDAVLAVLDPALLTEGIIGQMQQPLLLYLHELDQVTPPAAVELLFERAGGPKRLVRFPGLDHARGQYFQTERFLAALEEFLGAVWGT